jgi:hypothetical protein
MQAYTNMLEASGGGNLKANTILTTNWITLNVRMRSFTGQGCFEYAERLQELDMNVIAAAMRNAAGNEELHDLLGDRDVEIQKQRKYTGVECFLPLKVFIMKKPWMKITGWEESLKLERGTVASIAFSICWAHFLLHGSVLTGPTFIHQWEPVMQELAFEIEQKLLGEDAYNKHMATPSRVKLYTLDMAFIARVNKGMCSPTHAALPFHFTTRVSLECTLS